MHIFALYMLQKLEKKVYFQTFSLIQIKFIESGPSLKLLFDFLMTDESIALFKCARREHRCGPFDGMFMLLKFFFAFL